MGGRLLLERVEEIPSQPSLFPQLGEFDEAAPPVPIPISPLAFLAPSFLLLPTAALGLLRCLSLFFQDRTRDCHYRDDVADAVLERTFAIAPLQRYSGAEIGLERKDQLTGRNSFLPARLDSNSTTRLSLYRSGACESGECVPAA